MPIRRAAAAAAASAAAAAASAAAPPPEEKEKGPSEEAEKATPEESPAADVAQAASSATAAMVEVGEEVQAEKGQGDEAKGKEVQGDEGKGEEVQGEKGEAEGDAKPTENGKKADEEAEGEKEEKETGKKDDKCKDCAAGQCSTHCYVLLLRLKDGYKYEKAKGKKVKRTIPAWASVTSVASKKLPVATYAGNRSKINDILIEAMVACNERSGVSYQTLVKHVLKKFPEMELDRKKVLIKKAMKKHLEKGTIKQVKGKGLSGTFVIGKQSSSSKRPAQKTECLGDALPLIITRLCEPKEASYNLIKKYLEQHFPAFNIENKPDALKAALMKAVEKGLLEQITGKGATGTFQLKRSGTQSLIRPGTWEDAITAAITAMNEPKTCSTTTLKKYLLDANKDRKEYQLVNSLRRTLTKCKVLGWMEQITGHGFTGTYRLSFPFYPSPTILYPDRLKDTSAAPKRKRAVDSSDEDEEESEEEESEDEYETAPKKRTPQKRPPPKARQPSATKKSQSATQSKVAGKGRAPAKKSPAKKAVAAAKKIVKKPSASKVSATPSKATPVKRGAPAKKPKTPAVKKLNKQAAKQKVSSAEVVAKEAKRSSSRRSKPEETTPKESAEPPAKKPATKGGSREPKLQESSPVKPAVKKGAKSSKQSTRQSKRGKN